MRTLSTAWQRRLNVLGMVKQILVTIDLGRSDPGDDQYHLARQAQAYRFCTGNVANVSSAVDGRDYQFLPFVAEWPTVTRTLRPEERKCEITDVPVSLLGSSGFAEVLRDSGAAAGMTARLDLWAPGIDLEDVLPLAGGRITQARWDRITSGVALTITDGDPMRDTPYPPGPITREDFPDAPAHVVDVESRQTVFGVFTQPLRCVQIDRERKRFYVCDPPLVMVWTVQKGGEEIGTGWHLETNTAATGWEYSELVFDAPIDDIATGLSDEITCAYGVGISYADPISYLLDVAGVVPNDRAAFLLGTYFSNPELALPVAIDTTGNALDIVRSRLIPQTPFVFTLHRQRAELITLFDIYNRPVSRGTVGIGDGLIFRMAQQSEETQPENVHNALDLRCGDAVQVVRDAGHGDDAITGLLTRSTAANGRRYLKLDMPDLWIQLDLMGQPFACPAGRLLADGIARLVAMPHRPHQYQATWLHGMAYELGDRMALADTDQGLDDAPVRVTGLSYQSTGPVVTFQTEDET